MIPTTYPEALFFDLVELTVCRVCDKNSRSKNTCKRISFSMFMCSVLHIMCIWGRASFCHILLRINFNREANKKDGTFLPYRAEAALVK